MPPVVMPAFNITSMAPFNDSGVNALMPSTTKPRCAMDAYEITRRKSGCASATSDPYSTAMTPSVARISRVVG